MQFIVDHLARPDTSGNWTHLLPLAVDAALVEAKIKAKPGPLSFSTVSHRLQFWLNGITCDAGITQVMLLR